METSLDKLKKECADNRFYSFGTAKLFERRAKTYRRNRNLITFLGLAVPLVIGGTVLSFSTGSEALKAILIPAAGVLTLLQLVISLWALVSRWDEKNDYAVSAIKSNTRLTAEFNRLCNSSDEVINSEIPHLRDEYNRVNQEDTAHGVTEKEIRWGMRKALIHYNLNCPTCNEKPVSMTPSNCDICGNFPKRYNWV